MQAAQTNCFFVMVVWGFLLATLSGCQGGSAISGCPADLEMPQDVEVLGAHYDQELFVARLMTESQEVSDVVSMFRTSMEDHGWKIKVDSATDQNGGELVFIKDEERECTIFISRMSGQSSDGKAVNIDIKCDRK